MINERCYIVLNKELQMPVGKAAVQVGHGIDQVWECYLSMRDNYHNMSLYQLDMLKIFSDWKHAGRKKVLLQAKNDAELLKYKDKVLGAGHIVIDIVDNGVNFFEGKTRTGFVVFPVQTEIPELKRLQVYK